MSEPHSTPPHHGHGPQVHRITEARESHAVEQNSRVLKYTISMGVRMVCFVLAFFTHGWIQWVCFAGAIFLPYVAVVIANGGADLTKREPPAEFYAGDEPLLLTDAPAEDPEGARGGSNGESSTYDAGVGYNPPGAGQYAPDAPETIDGAFLEDPPPKANTEDAAGESGPPQNTKPGESA